MKALLWQAVIILSIFISFSSFGRRFGTLVVFFWVNWTIWLSKPVMGYPIKGPLFKYQMIAIVLAFLFCYFVHKRKEKDKLTIEKKISETRGLKKAMNFVIKTTEDQIEKTKEKFRERKKGLRLDKILLKKEKDVLEKERKEFDRLIKKHKFSELSDHTKRSNVKEHFHPINTVEEHRIQLYNALKIANHTICIHSGWATDHVVDEDFKNRILECLRRGVNIYIGYGYKSYMPKYLSSEYRRSIQTNKNAGKRLAEIMELSDRENIKGKLDVDHYGNHRKELICDDKFYIIGSFNWLSNKSSPNYEKSLKVTISEFVSKQSSIFLERFQKPNRQTRQEIINFLKDDGIK